MKDINLPPFVANIIGVLNSAGEDACVVGGCVRDTLLGKQPHDWDVTTSALPEKVMSLFPGKAIPTGLKHGTVTVLSDGVGCEVTTYRIDGDYGDGRHPDSVRFTTDIQQDLARRDFTVNAIAYAPGKGFAFPQNAMDDLRSRTITCVGDPDQRFSEDALRVMRAVRFSATLGFNIAPETREAVFRHISDLDQVSRERVHDELLKLLVGTNVKQVLKEYRDVIAAVIPEVRPCFDFDQCNPYHVYDVWNHIVKAVSIVKPDPILRMTMLLHDIGKPYCCQTEESGHRHFHGHGEVSAKLAGTILNRLRFSNEEQRTIVHLVAIHDRFIEANPTAVRRLLNQIGSDQFDRLLEVRLADVCAQNPEFKEKRVEKVKNLKEIKTKIIEENEGFKLKDLDINGRDLIAAGYQPGPEIGRILNTLLEHVLEHPEDNNKETLLSLTKNA